MRITSRAKRQAVFLGIAPTEDEAETVLEYWAVQAAICTHDNGNRRYEDYVFDIEDGVVLNVDIYDDEVYELDTSFSCEFCYDTGEVRVPDGVIPCPECQDAKLMI